MQKSLQTLQSSQVVLIKAIQRGKKKTTKSKKKVAADSKTKMKGKKQETGKEGKTNFSGSEVEEDPLTSYKKQLESFQDYMEFKLEEIMASDQIERSDAERIMKKFHSAIIEERNAMKKITQTYGNEIQLRSFVNYGSDENSEEAVMIKNQFQELDDAIKQEDRSTGQKEHSKSEDNIEDEIEVKKKTTKKKKNQTVTRAKNIKNTQTNPKTLKPMKQNYKTQTDSSRRRDSINLADNTKDEKNETSSLARRKEYASKLRNMRQVLSLEKKSNLKQNEKLMKILYVPTTDESSDSELLLNSVVQTKEKIGKKKAKETGKGKKENSKFQNQKSLDERARHDVMMNLLGEENLRRTYMLGSNQAGNKTPIFR